MTVSIIIPTLNEAAEISACIESARQSGAAEIIVADGGSSDGTRSLASTSADLVLVTPQGRAAQQNHGAKAATGDVLLFLHADTRLGEGCVRQIERFAATADNKPICGGFRQRIVAEGWHYRWLENGNVTRVRLAGMVYGDQGIFVSRDWFHHVGGFADCPIMEDVELLRALARSRGEFEGRAPVLLDGPLEVSPRRWQKTGVVRQTLRNWMMLSAWCCGASPEYLAKFYPPCPTVLSTEM